MRTIKSWVMQFWAIVLYGLNTEKSVARAREIERSLYNDLYNEVFKRSAE